jgi:transcriptional/translational regulatory protein YebC/TACO1
VFVLKDALEADEAFDVAVEAGADDVVIEEEKFIVYTPPAETKAIAEKIADTVKLEIASSEIVYDPLDDTKVDVDKEENVEMLQSLMDRLQDESGLQGIYTNATPAEHIEARWKEVLDGAN